MYEIETTEDNGTEVIVPIKKTGWNGYDDFREFQKKTQQQLSYFETIVIFEEGRLISDYKIYREEKFQFSTLNSDGNIHMCLKDVYYELNWQKLGISPIHLPVALRFGLDEGITPNPARESIIYNRETIELIKGRIAEVCKWFIDRYNEKIVERDSFMDIIDELNPYDSKYLEIYGERFKVSLLKDYGELETPKLKGISTLNVSTLHDKTKYFLYDYNFFGRLENRSWSSKDEEYGGYRRKKTILLMNKLKAGVPMFVVEEKPTRVLLDYISDKYGDCVFLKKNDKKIPLKVGRYSDKSSWERIVSLKLYPKEKWRTVLEEFKTIKDEICSRLIDISTVVPDDRWLEDRKKNKKRGNVTKVEKQEINPKYARWHGIIDGEVVFKSDGPQEVSTLTRMCVYGKQEDKDKLAQVFELFNNVMGVCILVDRDIKRTIENNLTNWYSIEQFMEGKLDVFGKFCTAILIDKLRNESDLVFKNLEFVQRIDEDFATKAQELMDWKREVLHNSRFPEELVTETMTICEEKNLWVSDKYETYLEIKEGTGNFAFIEHLKREEGYGGNRETIDISDEMVQFAKEIYNLKVNKNQEVEA